MSPYGPAPVQEEFAIVDCEGDHLDPGENFLLQIFIINIESSNDSSNINSILPARRLKESLF